MSDSSRKFHETIVERTGAHRGLDEIYRENQRSLKITRTLAMLAFIFSITALAISLLGLSVKLSDIYK